MTNHRQKKITSGGFSVRPGRILVDTSSATGGTSYDRTDLYEGTTEQGGSVKKYESTRTVDHVEAVKRTEAVVKKVDYLLRSHCVRSGFGWYVPEEDLRAVIDEFEKLMPEADEANAYARSVGSEARASLTIVPLTLEIDPAAYATKAAAHAITRTIHGVLDEIRELLRTGRVDKEGGRAPFLNAMNRARGLDQLATGVQATSIAFALERAAQARKEIRDATKKGAKASEVGAGIDLGALDAAIDMFAAGDDGGYGSIAAGVADAAINAAMED